MNGQRRCETHTFDSILFSNEKEGNPAICDNLNGSWGRYAKWNKSDRERQILHGITYTWNLKKVKFIATESGKVVTKGWGWGIRERLVKGYKLSAIKWIRSSDLMYNMMIIVDNTILYNWNSLRE